MQLDLNLLTALNALLDEQSVTGAAERLHLSEPAMSRTLGRIRRVTGDPILIRTGRTMTPTPRAIGMRDEVRSLVLRSQAVMAPVTAIELATLRRTFTLRAHDALVAALAPVVLKRGAEVAPQVRFRFLAEASADTADLGRGAVDLEVSSEVSGPSDIAREHVADDDLVGLATRVSAVGGAGLSLEQFTSRSHVVVSRRGRLRDNVDAALEALGVSRHVMASVASTAAALEIARDTGAIVTVPSLVAHRAVADRILESFSLPFALPRVPVVLSWHKRLDGDLAHAWLRELVAQAVRDEIGAQG